MAIFAVLGVPIGVVASSCSSSSGSEGSGGSDRDAGSDATAHPLIGCVDPQPLLNHGVDSGYVKCADGSIDRITAVACDDYTPPACDGTEGEVDCTSDADCPAHSRCGHSDDEFTLCSCISICKTNADCPEEEACICGGIGGLDYPSCMFAACDGPSDCHGGECGLTESKICEDDAELTCRDLEKDGCRSAADCPDGQGCYTPLDSPQDAMEPLVCAYQICEGRLLRSSEGLVSAHSVSREDWSEGRPRADCEALPEVTRRRLAEHWERIAATEHAAVASFARFSLQLLAVGAPPTFLEGAQRAAAEEIEHARRAYAIAGSFAGHAIGPGSLDACAIPLSGSRAALVEGLIDDACISELVNVTEVLAIASVATDDAVRAFAERTAADEERHVTLAWEVLRWALEGATRSERLTAKRRLQARIASLAEESGPRATIDAPAYGLLSTEDRRDARRHALRDIAAPAVDALFETLDGQRSARAA